MCVYTYTDRRSLGVSFIRQLFLCLLLRANVSINKYSIVTVYLLECLVDVYVLYACYGGRREGSGLVHS